MPVPKRKRSRARRDKRFANKGMKERSVAECANCKEALMTHQACKSCGHYKGRKVFATKADRTVKRTETRNAKEAKKAKAVEKPVEAKSAE
jgi:large subunit ribosomal protein L32